MNRDFIRHIHIYVARYSVSASAVRGQRAPGLVAAARKYLAAVPLRSFGIGSQSRFLRNLERHTEQLRTALPYGARTWGVARKVLNIFLRNALYTGYLRDRYHLDVAEEWYEIPLDSIVAKRLRGIESWRATSMARRQASDAIHKCAISRCGTHDCCGVSALLRFTWTRCGGVVRADLRHNKRLLLAGAYVLKELVFVRHRAHPVRASARIANGQVARSRNADR